MANMAGRRRNSDVSRVDPLDVISTLLESGDVDGAVALGERVVVEAVPIMSDLTRLDRVGGVLRRVAEAASPEHVEVVGGWQREISARRASLQPKPQSRTPVRDQVYALLAADAGAWRPTDIADALAVHVSQVSRSIRELDAQHQIEAAQAPEGVTDRRDRWYRSVGVRAGGEVRVSLDSDGELVVTGDRWLLDVACKILRSSHGPPGEAAESCPGPGGRKL